MARGVEGLALDAGFAAGTRPELGTALFGVVHQPLEAPALSACDDEVRGAGFAAVHELEALAEPPGQHAGELGVDRDSARPFALPALGFERLAVVLRGQMNAAEGLGLVVDVPPAQTADLPFTHAREQRQSGEDAGLGFGCDQPNDLVESVRLPRSTPMLSTQEAARQDARVDEHELLSAGVATRRTKEPVDIRDILLAKRAPRPRAHGLEQLAHELLSVPRPKLFAPQVGKPRATTQMGLDSAAIVHRVSIAAGLSPLDQKLTERHSRPLTARECPFAHLSLTVAIERLCGASIRPSALPDLFPVRIAKGDSVRDSDLVLSSDDGHHSVSF